MLGLHPGTAGATTWYWCDPLHAYYPRARTCPAAWRPVTSDPASQRTPPAPTPETAGAGTAPQPARGGEPTFTPTASLARGDALDEWCKGPTTAINMTVCGDDELRALAVERLQALSDANARLPADQRKVLAADQNGWAMSYPQGCGVSSQSAPSLPLASSMKECLAKAGLTRLAYLRTYGAANAGANPPTPAAGSGAAPPGAASTASAPASQPPAASPQPALPAAVQSASPGGTISAEPPPAAKALPPEAFGTARSPNANSLRVRSTVSGLLQEATMAGAVLLASLTVGVWIVVGLLGARERRRVKETARL
jgi:hypothetical protein